MKSMELKLTWAKIHLFMIFTMLHKSIKSIYYNISESNRETVHWIGNKFHRLRYFYKISAGMFDFLLACYSDIDGSDGNVSSSS